MCELKTGYELRSEDGRVLGLFKDYAAAKRAAKALLLGGGEFRLIDVCAPDVGLIQTFWRQHVISLVGPIRESATQRPEGGAMHDRDAANKNMEHPYDDRALVQPWPRGRCEKWLSDRHMCGKPGRWLVTGQVRCGEHKVAS